LCNNAFLSIRSATPSKLWREKGLRCQRKIHSSGGGETPTLKTMSFNGRNTQEDSRGHCLPRLTLAKGMRRIQKSFDLPLVLFQGKEKDPDHRGYKSTKSWPVDSGIKIRTKSEDESLRWPPNPDLSIGRGDPNNSSAARQTKKAHKSLAARSHREWEKAMQLVPFKRL